MFTKFTFRITQNPFSRLWETVREKVACINSQSQHIYLGPRLQEEKLSANKRVGSCIFRSLFAFSLFLFTCPSMAQQPNTKPVLAINHWQTASGIPVYFIQASQLPMLDLQVVFAAGSARDGKNGGLAQLTSGLLNEGSAQFSAEQIAQQFDSVGAIFNAAINRDMATVGVRSLTHPDYLTPALKTFTTVLTAPSFPEESFNRVKKQLLIQLEQDRQNPSTLAKKEFLKALYGDHPYSHGLYGDTTTVNALTLDEVKQFYQQFYVQKNALIAMVGDVTLAHAHAIAEQVSQALPIGSAAAPLPLALVANKPLTHHLDFPSQQTSILLGQVGITPQDPDSFPLLLGNYILGGGPLVSILFNEVREARGLAYHASSQFVPLAAKGPFLIFLQTRNEQATTALALSQQLLRDFVKKGPTPQQLSAAKQNIIGGFPLNFISNEEILSQIVFLAFYHLPLNYFDTYRQKINAVTAEQIQKAFMQRIHLNALTTITVGKTPVKTTSAEHHAA